MTNNKIISTKTLLFSTIFHLILIFTLISSPIVRKRETIKPASYKVSISPMPLKKVEEVRGTSKVLNKEKPSEVKEKVSEKRVSTKEKGMKPLKGKEKGVEEKRVEEYSPQGTKIESLDVPYFPFDYYISQVLSFISANWYKPPSPEGTFCVIYFIISKNGRIIEAKIESSSENSAFDRAALRAVLASNPLPPLPYDWYEEKLGIHLRFQ